MLYAVGRNLIRTAARVRIAPLSRGSPRARLNAFPRPYATAKAAAKPKSTPKPKTKKATAKKPTVKKVTAKKPKVKKEPSKTALEAQRRAKQKALVEGALKHPKMLPTSPYTLYCQEKMVESKPTSLAEANSMMKSNAIAYKALSDYEKNIYTQRATANKAANDVTYLEWVEGYTPLEIRKANLARAALRKTLGDKKTPVKYRAIKDARQPKRPRSALFLYIEDQFAQGHLKGMPAIEAVGQANKAFKALSASELKEWETKAVEDRQRYISEYRWAYNDEPALAKKVE